MTVSRPRIDTGLFEMAQHLYGFREIKFVGLLFETENFKIMRQTKRKFLTTEVMQPICGKLAQFCHISGTERTEYQ